MAPNKKTPVAVVMGSDSDLKVMQGCIDQLRDFGIDPAVRIISAHRTPDIAAEFAETAAANGLKVIIAAAGMAAHLAGALAAKTTLPVIGVPLISSSGLEGIDAFLSTVQMPPGVPVAGRDRQPGRLEEGSEVPGQDQEPCPHRPPVRYQRGHPEWPYLQGSSHPPRWHRRPRQPSWTRTHRQSKGLMTSLSGPP